MPLSYRGKIQTIRDDVSTATDRVRRELFKLREIENDYFAKLNSKAKPLELQVIGELNALSAIQRRIVDELVSNAALHSKGRTIKVEVSRARIVVSDDGQGFYGVAEMVEEIGGELRVVSNSQGTKVEIALP